MIRDRSRFWFVSGQFSIECRKKSGLLWLRFTSPYDWFRKTRATFSTNQNQKEINLDLYTHFFPRFRLFARWDLIGSSLWSPFIWLAVVISLVLVLRHSTMKRSNTSTFSLRRILFQENWLAFFVNKGNVWRRPEKKNFLFCRVIHPPPPPPPPKKRIYIEDCLLKSGCQNLEGRQSLGEGIC